MKFCCGSTPSVLISVLLAALANTPSIVCAQTVTGKVVGISDGDTITLLTAGNRQLKVRLDGIDAPENGQEFSAVSKQALSSLVGGKVVSLEVSGTDRYERILGTVIHEGRNVNLLMVRAGYAWHYVKYSDDPALAEAEAAARAEGRGLWAGFNPISPWDYRALKRKPQDASGGYWLNSSSGVRHNSSCKWFGQTSRGRPSGPDEGKACGICGGRE